MPNTEQLKQHAREWADKRKHFIPSDMGYEAVQHVNNLLAEVERLEEALVDEKSDYKEMKADYKSVDAKLEKVEETIVALEQKVEHLEKRAGHARDKRKSIFGELEDIIDPDPLPLPPCGTISTSTLYGRVMALKRAYNQSKQKVKELEAQLELRERELQSAGVAISAADNRIVELERENAELKEHTGMLEQQLTILRSPTKLTKDVERTTVERICKKIDGEWCCYSTEELISAIRAEYKL